LDDTTQRRSLEWNHSICSSRIPFWFSEKKLIEEKFSSFALTLHGSFFALDSNFSSSSLVFMRLFCVARPRWQGSHVGLSFYPMVAISWSRCATVCVALFIFYSKF
jgi:hypothetical protein